MNTDEKSELERNTKNYWLSAVALLGVIVVLVIVYGRLLNSGEVESSFQRAFVWFLMSFTLFFVSVLAFYFGRKGILHDSKYARFAQIPHGWKTLLTVFIKGKVKGKEEQKVFKGMNMYSYGVFFLITSLYFAGLGIATMLIFETSLKTADEVIINRGLHLYPSLLIFPTLLIITTFAWLVYKSYKELVAPANLKLLLYDLFWLFVAVIGLFSILIFGSIALRYTSDAVNGSSISERMRLVQKVVVDSEADVYVVEPESYSTISALSRMKSKKFIVVFEKGAEQKAFSVEEELYEMVDEGEIYDITYFPNSEEFVSIQNNYK